MKKSKSLGQVYTPDWIITKILNDVGYFGENILEKYILEPSCGEGAFLIEVVKRYIQEAKKKNWDNLKISLDLSQYIYGVEIDEKALQKCLANLNETTKNYEIDLKIDWKIFHADTLKWHQDYLNFFDFVVGNPPYIRIHHLSELQKEIIKKDFQFSTGSFDIYLSFFEIGIKSLHQNGKLGFITPNSFLYNSSYTNFRKYIIEHQLLELLFDFKSQKVFSGFSTYTVITILNKNNPNDYFKYQEFNFNHIKKNRIFFKEINDKRWHFSSEENISFLKELFQNRENKLHDFFHIQYGFATLRDKIFIGSKQEINNTYSLFNNWEIETSILKPIIKASHYPNHHLEWIIFPYEKQNGRYFVIEEEKFKKNYPKCYQYLLFHQEDLKKRDLKGKTLWYEFGRSQGVQNIHQEKILLNSILLDKVKFCKLPADILVYSGIFIVPKSNQHLDWAILENILSSEEFYKYLFLTGKNLSGGYKSISTQQIKEFKIAHKISQLSLFE